MPTASFGDVEVVVRTIAQVAVDNEKDFGDLDAVVGDGDFGYSMARGFELVLQDWDSFDRADIGTFLKKVAVVITSRIGGTSGPIWGTAFLRAGATAGAVDELEPAQVVAMLRAAITGIKARGKSDVGDKTLLDALVPAVDTIEAQIAEGHDAATTLRGGGGHRARAGRGDPLHAGHARAGQLHRRTQHRHPRRGRRRCRRDVRGTCWTLAGAPGPVLTPHGGGGVKKFVNDPRQFVPEMLKGIALANPDTLKYVPEFNLIMRTDAPRDDKVSIIQGSGSGHEPAHVMIVGKGMLDAACPGDVFAAPPMDYVLETSKLLNSPKGVLHIINNYTGDRMAFEMGQEMAEADGITIGTLLVDDDVAVKDSTYTVGRRGVAGNFFVIKAVGAASEQGADLDELLRIGNKVNSVTRTMGMALTSCTPPAKGSPLFELGDDEMEMGVGIHGEPGRRREKLASANEIVDELLEAVVTDLPFGTGDDVALMVNGLGGTPISELYLLYGYAHELLAQRGINVRRNYVGNYCTSLDMAGTSITLSRLDPEIEGLLAAPAEIAIRTF